MQLLMHSDRVKAILSKALSGGRNVNRTGYTKFEWAASGNCSAPILIQLTGRPRRQLARKAYVGNLETRTAHCDRTEKNTPYFCDIEVRCRQCERCTKARSSMWRQRAMYEIARASRTWFCTLTVAECDSTKPTDQLRIEYEARRRASENGDDWNSLTEVQQFRAKCTVLGEHVTLFMKRVRKESKASLRYFMVFEHHKSGAPHVHMLIHEQHGGPSASKRTLQSQWLLGFSQVKLVRQELNPENAAFYVAKYLSKDARARLRASLLYGRDRTGHKTSSGHSQPKVEREDLDPEGDGRGTGPAERVQVDAYASDGANFMTAHSSEKSSGELGEFLQALRESFGPDGTARLSKPVYRSPREHLYKQ